MSREPFKDARRAWGAIRGGLDGWLHGGGSGSNPERSTDRRFEPPQESPLITIREVMTPDPISIALDAPLHAALELLMHKDLSALPVLDADALIVGLLNERHLLNALGDPAATSVSDAMDTEWVMLDVDEPIVEVVDRLMTVNVRQVLVLENGKLVGVVTRADLMPAIHEVFRERAKRVSLVRH
jgi:CBS domain-containing protein